MNEAVLESIIGYDFKNDALLKRALTHDSAARAVHSNSYQNLEFFGDSILDFLVAEELMKRFPSADEGQLTRMRAAVVSERPLALTIERLGLENYLIMGKNERHMKIQKNRSVMSDLYEAVLAAIYLDGGMDEARAFVLRTLSGAIAESARSLHEFYDYKSELNEYANKNALTVSYMQIFENPDDQQNRFEFSVALEGDILGIGRGRTKKEAEQHAACQALQAVAQKPKEN